MKLVALCETKVLRPRLQESLSSPTQKDIILLVRFQDILHA